MSYCCSQCSFTAQFESALMMHRQLHHDAADPGGFHEEPTLLSKEKSNASPCISPPLSPFSRKSNKGFKLPCRTSSATRLLGKLRARITKSRTLFSHPQVPEISNNLSIRSDCTSKALKSEGSRTSAITTAVDDQKETYACHLCSFEADRITVLDRHLLNDHKIGLENLLKLVMAKTKDGLSEERNTTIYGIRQPYYKPQDEIIEDGEFIIETVTPKIKILKHASTNTEDQKELNLERNCEIISKEIENLINGEKDCESKEFLTKMQSLHNCMFKFANSSNALKKMLAKDFDGKKERFSAEPFFNLGLGDRETPRNWERGAQSEKMERSRHKYTENGRVEKSKQSAESFYF